MREKHTHLRLFNGLFLQALKEYFLSGLFFCFLPANNFLPFSPSFFSDLAHVVTITSLAQRKLVGKDVSIIHKLISVNCILLIFGDKLPAS